MTAKSLYRGKNAKIEAEHILLSFKNGSILIKKNYWMFNLRCYSKRCCNVLGSKLNFIFWPNVHICVPPDCKNADSLIDYCSEKV